jgi:hypothetical protein
VHEPIEDTEQLHDPNGFLLTFPLFAVAHGNSTSEQVHRGQGFIVFRQEGKTDFVPIFTDMDLADRFLAKHGDPALVKVRLKDMETFRAFLLALTVAGVTLISFDPTERARVCSLAVVMRESVATI